ncbi:uncharacterized protein CDAR_20911 [Caerostris darwini]|uniref:Uncharacterized protein n=1 Tax=Caerostris darwini TaxID=1538125 RepID=A0AAV4MWA0_9ARAC|nr:uncharacterized protein CDAR_20911 [Caerostris darwini]
MSSAMWILAIAVVTVLVVTSNAMEFEQFMSALARKEDDSEKVEEPSEQKGEEIVQFMKRSGLLEPQSRSSNSQPLSDEQILSALQALQRQQNLLVYNPEYAESATPQQRAPRDINKYSYSTSTYQSPSGKDSNSHQSQQATLAALQSLSKQQLPYSSQSSDSSSQPRSAISSQGLSDSTSNLPYSTRQQDTGANDDKSALKDDRQGHYGYDTHSGYETGYARNPHGYEAEGYSHEPVGYNKQLKLPIPSVSIKFDPLGLLKLLLQKIPRPLFNLNGRIFLGLELGKGIGLGKGPVHYPAGHGGGKIITIG